MTTPDELRAAPAYLAQAMQRDTTLRLALAAAWLDPLHFAGDADAILAEADELEPDSLVLSALAIARRCLLPLYAELVRGVHEGWSFNRLEAAFCAGMQRAYPLLEIGSLDQLLFGAPLPFAGLEVTGPDFPDRHPDYASLLAAYFDLRPIPVAVPGSSGYCAIDESDFEALQPIADRLVRSLVAEERQPCADLALLLMYLFSRTGNSLLDFSEEGYWDAGFDPLGWDAENLRLANDACSELVLVLHAVERARQALDEDESLCTALKDNIAALTKATGRRKHVALTWPYRDRTERAEPGAGRNAGLDPVLLLLRNSRAQAG